VNFQACALCIVPEILHAAARFNGHNTFKPPGQRQRKQPGARIEVPRGGAAGISDGETGETRQQEPVHLKERRSTYRKAVVVHGILQGARDRPGYLIRQPVEEPLRDRPLALKGVPLHLPLIGKHFERPHKIGPAPIAYHPVQPGDNLVDFWRTDGALPGLDEIARIHLPVAGAAPLEMELRAIAVSERLTGFGPDPLRIELDLAHAPQCFRKYVAFEAQLGFVTRMLVVASAASAKNGARRNYADRGWLRNANQAGPLYVLARKSSLCFDRLPGQYKRREHYFAIQAAQPVAAVHQLLDSELQRLEAQLDSSILSEPLCRWTNPDVIVGDRFRQRSTMRALRVWLSLLTAALTAYPVFSQGLFAQNRTAANLDVAIHSLQGEAIPRATLSLQTPTGSPPPGGKFTALTTQADGSGDAHFTGLAPGRYRLTIVAKGYDELTTDVDVNPPESINDAAGTTVIDAILTMGGTRTDSITVQGVIDTPLEEANTPAVLDRQQVKDLPDRPRTVTEALPLSPGIVRLPNGQLRLAGSGEHRSAMLVNSATATDPATGQFGATVPIDSVRTMNILSSPFLAEYGGFTGDVVTVETRKAGDKWSFELNDPLPEFRWRSWHMVGLRSETPRVNFGGPIIRNRFYFLESIQYEMRESPVITLPFPNNESRREGYNSLTALDYTINPSNVVNGTFHMTDSHTRFANLDFFDPQQVTPNTSDSSYSGNIIEHASFKGTLLDSAISATSYRAGVWPQGPLDMIMTPSTNEGNYFSQQTRTSSRFEWRETWSLAQQVWGTHNLKLGSVVGGSTEHALITEHPVDIFDGNGALIENITFTPGLPIARNDVESAFFAQDQWSLNSRVSLSVGVRVSQQEVTEVWQVGPRAGLVYSPFKSGRTVFRAGTGIFYDRVPLNVYGFALYPDEIITTYNPDGTVLSGPYRYFNLTEAAAPHHSPLIYRKNGLPGDFSPYSINSNVQLEQILSPRLRLRANYLLSNSEELIVLAPQVTDTTHAFVLNGAGNSRLRQLEVTAAASAGKESQIYLSYVHSYSMGNLNEFNTYLADFPPAVILPDAHTWLPGDTPNRFLAWGTFSFPHKFRVMPKVEYRSGFPWSSFSAAQQYFGIPDSSRFPASFSVDTRVTKDFKLNDKYSVRFGVSGSNLTNHFNPISVHANIADPAYGLFFGEYHRRYTADFDVLF